MRQGLVFQRLKIRKHRELQDYVDADCTGNLEASKEALWLRGLVETFSIM